MEVVYYQPQLLALVRKREGIVRSVADQLKNKVSDILTPVKVGENGSSRHSNP